MQLARSEKSQLAAPVGALMRPTGRISPEDSLERAAAALRLNGGGVAPVVENERLVGAVSDTSLALAMAEGADLIASAKLALMQPETIAPYATGAEALRRLAEGDGRPLIVVDDMRRPIGLISTADLYPFKRPEARPAMVGGMATPFGVYLTTGAISGGVKWWALMFTGASMMSLLVAADLIANPITDWIGRRGAPANTLGIIEGALALILFLVGMRLVPLSGTHGAEHQVVHAIERGEDLVPDVVRRMPRVHPVAARTSRPASSSSGAW